MEPVLWLVLTWLALGITTLVCGVLATSRPTALTVGRLSLGALMIGGGALVNGYFLATGVNYDDFADESMFGFVTDTWQSVVAPRQVFWIGLLITFEAIVGLLVLLGHRLAVAGMVGVIGFHIGLMFFGWAFWPWAVPMIVGVSLLLRGQLKALHRLAHPPGRQTRAPHYEHVST
ncbi:MAG TPA: hypothetical protein VFX15_04285 [Actinomycetes bacterium]|nr:hypothetical protein [Actinomycetes bacterium]